MVGISAKLWKAKYKCSINVGHKDKLLYYTNTTTIRVTTFNKWSRFVSNIAKHRALTVAQVFLTMSDVDHGCCFSTPSYWVVSTTSSFPSSGTSVPRVWFGGQWWAHWVCLDGRSVYQFVRVCDSYETGRRKSIVFRAVLLIRGRFSFHGQHGTNWVSRMHGVIVSWR